MRLPFQPDWRPRVLDGTKTTTVRTRRYGVAGDTFDVDGVTFRLTEVIDMALSGARDGVWRDEGFDSPDAFEHAWIANHPTRGFRGADSVWVHRFVRADEPA